MRQKRQKGSFEKEFEFKSCSSVSLKCEYQRLLHKWNRILRTRAQNSYASKFSYYQDKE